MRIDRQKIIKPVIGIIGGSGPEATINFQLTLLKTMQEILKPTKDQDHYRVIIDNDPSIPDRSLSIINQPQEIIDLYISKASKLEQQGANLILIACNTAHVFIKNIQKAISSNIVNIIEETVADFVEHNNSAKNICILSTIGTFSAKIYQQEFLKYGVIVEELSAELIMKVHKAIYGIKAGLISELDKNYDHERLYNVYKAFNERLNYYSIKSPYNLLIEILEEIRERGIMHVILGCTELPIVLNNKSFSGLSLYDPAIAVAKKLVHSCNSIANNNIV